VNIETLLKDSKQAAYKMATLSTQTKNTALNLLADEIQKNKVWLLEQNSLDLSESKNKLSDQLYARLELSGSKIDLLVKGIRDVARLEDPSGKILLSRELDSGLTLEKQSVPIGVLAVIFESRPDVMPQILSLALKSGNAVVLKGGSEAKNSNLAFMKIISSLNDKHSLLPKKWAQLIENRESVAELLKYPEYVDLVIPRGSNELVQSIQRATKIPVLGHADGICHLFVEATADISQAVSVVIDSKIQSPSACNSVETLLVDESIAKKFLPEFYKLAESSKVILKGCPKSRVLLPAIQEATEEDWKTEYGDLRLSLKIVSGLSEAVEHINRYGSHHTDGILSTDESQQELFLSSVDSASVFVNSSLRFADGFRYGFGAEVGISTNKTHARGPVGLEGLVIYKYKVRGKGHLVADYVGPNPKPFRHRDI
jgi:glutamate-5-semialdehyde dehydrogenase